MDGHVIGEGEGERIQPPAPRAVPTKWLAPFAGEEEARRLAELQADNELLNRIMWADYAGPEWDLLADRLIAYGYAVFFAWLRKGSIFQRCEQRGVQLRRTERSRDRAEATSLAGETVTLSVVKFRETVLIPRVWRPDGGASLETFFVGQCLIRFPNIYRRWLKENGWGGADALDNIAERRAHVADAHQVLRSNNRDGEPGASHELDAHLDLAPDELTRSILGYVADDFTYEEIALLLDTTVGAIKSRLYRLRQLQRKDGTDAA